jgi:thiol-disulfide isomerase/thioredoxin
MMATNMKWRIAMGFALAGLSLAALASEEHPLSDATLIPHVAAPARETYNSDFLQSDRHRAFAIAPGGSWGWVSDMNSAEESIAGALEACRKHSEIRCVPYAVDDRVVFDEKTWPTLWGPYKNKAEAAKASVGKKRGERFHDLALVTDKGREMKLSDWRGKVTVVHFWGSWCPPCRRELPDLQKLVAQFRGVADVAFVLLQVRENGAAARQWLAAQHLDLPLYDSGVKSEEDEFLKLAGGSRIKDRDVAMAFPTTYVLDKHGVVVFSHAGPISDWGQYAPFLRDVATGSGK